MPISFANPKLIGLVFLLALTSVPSSGQVFVFFLNFVAVHHEGPSSLTRDQTLSLPALEMRSSH